MKYGIAEMKRVILANVKHLFSAIPIIGALGHIGGAAKKEASIEMILTLLFSRYLFGLAALSYLLIIISVS
jgi:hypothetical protein